MSLKQNDEFWENLKESKEENMEIHCEVCDVEISLKMADASMNQFRKCLCIDHQMDVVKRTYQRQPELMKLKLAELGKYKGMSSA